MSDPLGRLAGMLETQATATGFRNHFAQIANAVGYRQDRCVVKRHGKVLVALVSYEDLEFLRKHRPRKAGPSAHEATSPKAGWREHFPVPPLSETDPATGSEIVTLIDPFEMPIGEVRTYYDEFKDRNDNGDLLDWIACASVCLMIHERQFKSSA